MKVLIRQGALVAALLGVFVPGSWAGSVVAAAGSVEVAFSPWDDTEGLVLKVLRDARQSVLVQAYVLTSRNIAAALQAARQRGVDVRLLADKEQMDRNENSLVAQVAASGVAVRLETRYSAAHNKVLVVDVDTPHPVVVTGSYNFSWSAQARNAENLLVLRDNPALARLYRDNWLRHWQEAEPLDGVGETATQSRTNAGKRSPQRTDVCALLTVQERKLLGRDCR